MLRREYKLMRFKESGETLKYTNPSDAIFFSNMKFVFLGNPFLHSILPFFSSIILKEREN